MNKHNSVTQQVERSVIAWFHVVMKFFHTTFIECLLIKDPNNWVLYKTKQEAAHHLHTSFLRGNHFNQFNNLMNTIIGSFLCIWYWMQAHAPYIYRSTRSFCDPTYRVLVQYFPRTVVCSQVWETLPQGFISLSFCYIQSALPIKFAPCWLLTNAISSYIRRKQKPRKTQHFQGVT